MVSKFDWIRITNPLSDVHISMYLIIMHDVKEKVKSIWGMSLSCGTCVALHTYSIEFVTEELKKCTKIT